MTTWGEKKGGKSNYQGSASQRGQIRDFRGLLSKNNFSYVHKMVLAGLRETHLILADKTNSSSLARPLTA